MSGTAGRSRGPRTIAACPAAPTVPDDPGAELRQALVDRLQRAGRLRDDRVAAAFGAVPREAFLPGSVLADVYRDQTIVTHDPVSGAATSSSSQPTIMAVMLEMLGVRPGALGLEIGAGTGYNAALLAHLIGPGGAVTSVELDREVAGDARDACWTPARRPGVVVGDGRDGWVEGAPSDGIVVTASAGADAPGPWHDQLAGGRLVVPLARPGPR